jgi:hypothetical protein
MPDSIGAGSSNRTIPGVSRSLWNSVANKVDSLWRYQNFNKEGRPETMSGQNGEGLSWLDA